MAMRYMAFRAIDRAPLDLDLPLNVTELGWTLNGAGALRATVEPDVGLLRAADGRLLLEEWGTLLFAEDGGEIRWGGILITSGFRGEAWEIEAAEMSTYPHGMAYTGLYSKIGVDPAQVVRDVWAHLQAQPDGDLGITVSGDSTPARLGKPAVPEYTQVFVDGAWRHRSDVDDDKVFAAVKSPLGASMKKTDTSLTLATPGAFNSVPVPFTVKIGSETILVQARSSTKLSSLVRGTGKSVAAGHGKGTSISFAGTATRKIAAVPAEPYVLSWDEATDLGGEIRALSDTYGFDLVESHRWSGETIASAIKIVYPSTGARRADLAFVQGDNVIDVVSPAFNGDAFANVVVGIGAGEGRKSVHRTTAVRDGRLRRTAVYTDKSVKDPARLDLLIDAEIRRRLDTVEITEITVRNHDNARFGSWALGDSILVEAVIPWAGEVSLWHRVIGWSLVDEDTARIQLARFTYGG